MTTKVQEILDLQDKNALAGTIANLYTDWDQKRMEKVEEWKELRNYIYATDTRTTTNAKLPWKNSTTIPKICQINDNLLANYNSALFSNDNWLRWEAEDYESADKEKAEVIEDYVKTKARESNLEREVEKLLYDYVQYGNAFAEVIYVNDINDQEDETIVRYRGAKLRRISPYDMVFNPVANDFKETPKIARYVKSIGELENDIQERPDLEYDIKAINKLKSYRETIGAYRMEDVHKAEGFMLDGFGNYADYIQSGYVEVLEFDGSLHDLQTGEFLKDYIVTVLDRKWVLRKVKNPSWLRGNKAHVAWRERPDNLYGMGPLDNLVGMQYRIDHLENLKADALDLTIHPPIKRVGEVEDFVWRPGEQIEIPDSDGDVVPMPPNAAAFQVNNEIAYLEAMMESMAGAPREAMGIRSPGEKTAFEIQQLQNAAGRIFQDKIRRFEKFLEDLLNTFLEVSRRNFDGKEAIRGIDQAYGAQRFQDVTKEDITAKGKLRPIGSRHFAQQAQFLQNVQGVFNSPIGQMIQPHIQTAKLANLVSDFLGWDKYGIIGSNAGIAEQADQATLIDELQGQVDMQKLTPNPLEE
jgi:hypothetical protein